MDDFSTRYLGRPYEEYQGTKDLDNLLREFELVDIIPHRVEVSLEFWKMMQCSKEIRLKPNGDIFYKYLKVVVNPQQETNFLLY